MSVPELAGHKLSVAFEDARTVHVNSDLTEMIQESINKLDEDIDEMLSELQSESTAEQNSTYDRQIEDLYEVISIENVSDDQQSAFNSHHEEVTDIKKSSDLTQNSNNDETPNIESDNNKSTSKANQENEKTLPAVVDRLEIFWPDDNA